MKKISALIRTSIIDAFTYRGDVLLYTLGNFAQPLIFLLVWLALIASGGNILISRSEFIQYYLLVILVHLGTSAWDAPFISRDIRLGNISPFLTKPIPYILFQAGNNLGEKILKYLYVIPMIVILGLFFGLNIPPFSIVELILFIVSLIIAASLMFFVDQCIGISAFWIEDSRSIDEIWDVFLYFFSGRLVPLIALSVPLQKIADILPFRYTLSFPIEIITHKLTAFNIISGFLFGLTYLFLVVILYLYLWRKGLKRYSASGA